MVWRRAEKPDFSKGFLRFGKRFLPKEMTAGFRERSVLRVGIENFTKQEILKIKERIVEAEINTENYLIKQPYGPQDPPKM